jgi:3'(2'), 5'-bisphosphate nucleotidase
MHNIEILDVDEIVRIAQYAGEEILDIYQKNKFEKFSKADDSLVTIADLAAHDIIVGKLSKLTLTVPILSEESALTPWKERRKWEQYWLIDPLDGTKEFINGNGEFTVNIALIYKSKPVLGVVYAPVLRETWVGVEGRDAYKIKNNEISTIKTLPHKDGELWSVVGSRSHADKSLQEYLELMGEYQLIPMGSSLKFCMVAEGKAHIYPRLGPTSEWDTAAAHAVVIAAGGKVSDIHNKPLLYNAKSSIRNPYFVVIG